MNPWDLTSHPSEGCIARLNKHQSMRWSKGILEPGGTELEQRCHATSPFRHVVEAPEVWEVAHSFLWFGAVLHSVGEWNKIILHSRITRHQVFIDAFGLH